MLKQKIELKEEQVIEGESFNTSVPKDYQNKKSGNAKVAYLMQLGHFSTFNHRKSVQECGNWLHFIATKDFSKKKLFSANFCNDRFCPTCAWRKAHKDAEMVATMMTAIKEEKDYDYLFLTLTVPNVKGSYLKRTITKMNHDFGVMTRRKRFAFIQGYMRKLEVTYNWQRDDYHPHFHVVIAVKKDYFTNDDYMDHEEWLHEWRKVTGNSKITQVNVEKVKDKNNSSAILEIAKYSAKDEDYTRNLNVFSTFYKALKGRQLMVFNKVFKEYRKKYEVGELEKYSAREMDNNQYYWLIVGTWSAKEKLYESQYRRLTDEEIEDINKRLSGEEAKEKKEDRVKVVHLQWQRFKKILFADVES